MSWRKVSEVLCNRKLLAKVKGKMYKSFVRPTMLYRIETVAVTERQVEKMEVAELNGQMGTGSDKKGQDKKRIHERDRENCKAGRQTSECKATLVWTCEKERRRLREKNNDRYGSARQKKKRKAKEKVDGFGERRHGKGWIEERRRSRSSEMENTVVLWQPRVGRSLKKTKNNDLIIK